MSQLVTVYDPKGEPFEVVHERGSQLVLNNGWSFAAPSADPEPVAVPQVEEVSEVVEDDTTAYRRARDRAR